MNRIFHSKPVTLFLFAVAAAWLFVAGGRVFFPEYAWAISPTYFSGGFLFHPIGFFLLRNHLEYTNGGDVLNYVDIVFYSLLLTGAIISMATRYKETRLLEWALACILLYRVLSGIYLIVFYLQNFAAISGRVGYSLASLAIDLLWVLYAWKAFKSLRDSATLSTEMFTTEDNRPQTYYVQARRWQRLAHYVVDFVLSQLICWMFLYTLIGDHRLNTLSRTLGDGVVGYGIIIPALLIYYLFFEGLLGITPGKLLTGCRVANDYGDRPAFGKILGRTFSRLVPFEAFSAFIEPWHDTWSHTLVLKEARKVINPRYYLWLLPLVVFLIALPALGLPAWASHVRDVEDQAYEDDKYTSTIAHLQHLNSSDFIRLASAYNINNEEDARYLKIESATATQIRATVFASAGPLKDFNIVKIYESLGDGDRREVNISVADLMEAVARDDVRHARITNGARLLGDNGLYQVDRVQRLFGVWIKEDGYTHYKISEFSNPDEDVLLSLENTGSSGRLIAIKSMDKNVVWNTELPLSIHGCNDRGVSYGFQISGTNHHVNSLYKARLIFVSDHGDTTRFLLKGHGEKYTTWPDFTK